jgi:hypothetical protein
MPSEPIMIELTPVEPASTSVSAAEVPAAPEQIQDKQDKLIENTPTPLVEEPIADKETGGAPAAPGRREQARAAAGNGACRTANPGHCGNGAEVRGPIISLVKPFCSMPSKVLAI